MNGIHLIIAVAAFIIICFIPEIIAWFRRSPHKELTTREKAIWLSLNRMAEKDGRR